MKKIWLEPYYGIRSNLFENENKIKVEDLKKVLYSLYEEDVLILISNSLNDVNRDYIDIIRDEYKDKNIYLVYDERTGDNIFNNGFKIACTKDYYYEYIDINEYFDGNNENIIFIDEYLK